MSYKIKYFNEYNEEFYVQSLNLNTVYLNELTLS